jgi:hypothetical protein
VQTTNYAGASPMFAAPASYDYHLLPGSPCVDAGSSPTATPPGGLSLVPTMEYVHPAMVEGRVTVGVIDIGAYELGGATPLVDGGGAIDLALGPGVDAGDIVTGVGSHGCGCTLGARPPQSGRFLFSLIALISLMLFRFRTNRA